MDKLAFASVATLRSLIASGEITAAEAVEFFLRRFEAHDQQLKSALEIFDKESILAQTDACGDLTGIPGLIKDNISMNGRRLSCASKILEGYHATYDATAIRRLKSQGAPLIGRANMDEFAMGSSTESSAFAKTKNPWDVTRAPGGSSGGSAAAVAAGLVPWALGSDTGGSVRQPAALCGIVGMKPTYGLVSRYGLVAYGSSLDQIGIFTRSVRDSAQILSAIAGHDLKDSSSLRVEKKDYTSKLTGDLPAELRIGVVGNAVEAEGMDEEIVAAIQTAVGEFEKLGAKVKTVQIPSIDYAAAAYFIISRAEAASNLARFDGVRYGARDKKAATLTEMYTNTRHDGFGSQVKERIMVGNYVLSAGHANEYYGQANIARRVIRRDFLEMFRDVHMLIMPTHPVPAFKLGSFDMNKLQLDLQDYFTCAMNLAGLPAIALPCGMTKSKLPIGFQLIGPHLSEGVLYQIAHAYEQQAPWKDMHPEGF